MELIGITLTASVVGVVCQAVLLVRLRDVLERLEVIEASTAALGKKRVVLDAQEAVSVLGKPAKAPRARTTLVLRDEHGQAVRERVSVEDWQRPWRFVHGGVTYTCAGFVPVVNEWEYRADA